jgi:hypothetical protein
VTARATSNPPLRIDVCDYGQAPPSVRRRYERTTARVGEVGIDGVGLLIARSPAARSLRDLASSRRALDSRRLAEASRSSASRLGSSAFSRLATSTARRQRTAVPSSARGAASNQNRATRESVPTSERPSHVPAREEPLVAVCWKRDRDIGGRLSLERSASPPPSQATEAEYREASAGVIDAADWNCGTHSPHVRLTPDPRPAADAETGLQGPVLLAVLDSCPDEQSDDKNAGQEDEDPEDNRRRDVHLKGVPA